MNNIPQPLIWDYWDMNIHIPKLTAEELELYEKIMSIAKTYDILMPYYKSTKR